MYNRDCNWPCVDCKLKWNTLHNGLCIPWKYKIGFKKRGFNFGTGSCPNSLEVWSGKRKRKPASSDLPKFPAFFVRVHFLDFFLSTDWLRLMYFCNRSKWGKRGLYFEQKLRSAKMMKRWSGKVLRHCPVLRFKAKWTEEGFNWRTEEGFKAKWTEIGIWRGPKEKRGSRKSLPYWMSTIGKEGSAAVWRGCTTKQNETKFLEWSGGSRNPLPPEDFNFNGHSKGKNVL